MKNFFKNLKTLPNQLTLIRFLTIPIIVYGLFSDLYFLSIIFLLISNITDILDGYFARKLNLVSNFGEYFDFFVDFSMTYAIMTSLIIKGVIVSLNIYLFIIVSIAFLIISILLSLNAKRFYMPHRTSSKLLAVLVALTFYLFFLKLSFANIFLLCSFIIINTYTIPDYLVYALMYREGKSNLKRNI